MFDFTPDQDATKLEIPDFEDARADFAPYYSTTTSLKSAQRQVLDELAKLGAGAILFRSGKFDRRYGYLITFQLGTAQGVIRVAGLPIRAGQTDRKIEAVRIQALLNVRDWLKAAVTSQVFSPGSNPLLQHILVDGRRTVADYIMESGRFPELAAGEIVEGDFEE
jgi:hypothetical protein